jgi:hypothetical protein
VNNGWEQKHHILPVVRELRHARRVHVSPLMTDMTWLQVRATEPSEKHGRGANKRSDLGC